MLGRVSYPFAAIVGQEEMKEAILIALTNPLAGGLLIGGCRGVAKSVIARSCEQLTEQKLVNLPLNITEDMLFGSIDVEYALKTGMKRFQPGLLAKAQGQLLYIDEANLLRQELLIATLDANLNGCHIVERDGISYKTEVDYTIIATMNPEEGSLPSNVLDRFGMYVEATGTLDACQRMEIVQRVLSFESHPKEFFQKYDALNESFRQKLKMARALLPKVKTSNAILLLVAKLCSRSLCAGHRADIYLVEAARGIAALAGRAYVLPQDVEKAAVYVLAHRQRQLPEKPEDENLEQDNQENDTAPEKENREENTEQEQQNHQDYQDNRAGQTGNQENSGQQNEQKQDDQPNINSLAPEEQVADIAKGITMPRLLLAAQKRNTIKRGCGKRSITRTDLKQGRYVKAELPKGKLFDLAFDATLRAAAPYQKLRSHDELLVNIGKDDMRQKVREKRIGNTFLFAVDASGSMGAMSRMRAVKGAIFTILQEAYQKRDQVGMIAFRRNKAEVLLPVTRSVTLAQKCLAELPTGGKTPLGEGLRCALQLLTKLNRQEQQLEPVFVLVTDGRANSSACGENPVEEAMKLARKIRKAKITAIVIDTENDFIKLGLSSRIAEAMGANYYSLQKLIKEDIIHILRNPGL